MSNAVLAYVPLVSGVFYLGLLALVRRHAPPAKRGVTSAYLALMVSWSLTSALWRLNEGTASGEPLLRLVEAQAMSLGGVFLFLFQHLHPSRWSWRARVASAVTIAAVAAMTLTGALNRVAIANDPAAGPLAYVVFAVGITAWAVSFVLGAAYLVFAYRTQRDPIERNRVKYAGVAAVCIWIGQATNSVAFLRELPVDHAVNIVAASLLAFSVARYHLFDVDLLLRRGFIRVLATAPVVAIGMGFVAFLFEGVRIDLLSWQGTANVLALAVAIGLLGPAARMRAEALVHRVFVGGRVEHHDAAVAFTRRTLEMRDVDAIAREVAKVCQWTTESGCVALLLLDPERRELRLAEMSGPFQRVQRAWTIHESNAVLQALVARGGAVTPLALEQLLRETDASPGDVAEFAPYRTNISVPITAHSAIVGCVFVAPKVYEEPFSLRDLETLALVAGQAGIALQNALFLKQWRERAQTDYLTGLPNHRHLQELLGEMLSRHEQEAAPFAVVMIDVDNFRMLNEVHGHVVGDDALRTIAAQLREALRPDDVLGRYGGDEFLALLPGMTAAEAESTMTAIGRGIRKLTLVASSGEERAKERLPARISWGIAEYPRSGLTARSLISAADSELMRQRFAMRRSGGVHTDRPNVRALLEQDPERLRIARALLDIIDAKDPYTSEHSQQIASFALLMAEELRLSDEERYALWLGSLLHDVGKIGTPASVLRKPGRLTPEEWDQMRRHPALGEQIVRGLLHELDDVIGIVGAHHERWDGSGYPRGLKGDDIPRLARMVSVADAFSAMVHDRPYRKGMSWSEAADELQRAAGTQLDPEMVTAFVRAVGQGEERRARAA